MCEHCDQAIEEAGIAYHETGVSREAAMDPGLDVGKWLAEEVHRQLELQNSPGPGPGPCKDAQAFLRIERRLVDEVTVQMLEEGELAGNEDHVKAKRVIT